MLIALALSIIFSLAVGILAARKKRAEAVIIPLLDVLQSIPILGFFPIVILAVISVIPGPTGTDVAITLLIFTSMSWNIAFGVYEAVKSIPQEYIELTSISNASAIQRITSLYIPASLSRVAYNTQVSWAEGLFYLVSSEILTLGGHTYNAGYGIGIAIDRFIAAGDYTGYVYTMISLVIAVVIWRFVFLREFSLWSEKYKMVEETRRVKPDPLMRFYSWVSHKSISKLFPLARGSGVTRFTSSLSRFSRGTKYAVAIVLAILVIFEVAAAARSGLGATATLPPLATVLADEGNILAALLFSFARVWIVFVLCTLIGVPLGIVISLRMGLYDTVAPLLEVISSIPGPALLPLIVAIPLIGHSGEAVAAIIIFLTDVWYVTFNVMAGVRTLPGEIFELGKIFHISRLSAWRNVYLPSVMTAYVTGAITAVGGSWNALIIAEYFTFDPSKPPYTQVGTGIGKTIAIAAHTGDLLTLALAVLSMTALVVTFNLVVWRRVYHYVTRRFAYNR